MEDRSGVHVVRTPEGVEFSQPLAGPVSRFLAWLLDIAVLAGVNAALFTVFGILSKLLGAVGAGKFLLPFIILAGAASLVAYPILFEWRRNGQTIGKRAAGIRVIDARGLPLSPLQVVVRNLLRPIDMFPVGYIVGGISLLLTRQEQRLGDLAAGTVVVRIPETGGGATPAFASAADKYNSLWEHPHVVARLRQAVPPEEAAVALQAVLRRERLLPEARVELFRELAARLKSRTDIPAACEDGISDEQFVRNVLQVLHNRRKPAA